MNTNKITQMNGTVNVTIHKNHLAQDNSSYAKVKRNTAGMNNVIATILSKTKVFDEASLIATSILFKDAILELISQGLSVNLLELGTIYPSVQGSIKGNNPTLSDIPSLSLGFTPSQESLLAIKKADVTMTKLEDSNPKINTIEDLSTGKSDLTVTSGKPIRITGSRLKIAGDKNLTGLFFIPESENGFDYAQENWIRIDDNLIFKNTDTFLEIILPENLESQKRFVIAIKTQSTRGKALLKSVKTMIYDEAIVVN